ncbi:MAG: rRNA pseudouridine synthase [Clostridiales bacterium]|nr:rRNA pseudouridine synthase [Clostridiales bacterium]
MQIRLDKFLADVGIGTRSEVKTIIKRKAVTVNGEIAVKPETKVNPDTDEVAVDGRAVILRGKVTYLLHKPAGYVCAVKDNFFPTVMELVPQGKDLFPVGRLDKDTEGLLLITNDGMMAHRMLSPRSHVDKTYLAVLDRPAEDAYVSLFAEGVDIGDDTPTHPARLVICDADAPELAYLPEEYRTKLCPEPEEESCTDLCSEQEEESCTDLCPEPAEEYHTDFCSGQVVLLTIHEGRYHQVKRMFHAVGREVVYLKRLSFGTVKLPLSLKKGEWQNI